MIRPKCLGCDWRGSGKITASSSFGRRYSHIRRQSQPCVLDAPKTRRFAPDHPFSRLAAHLRLPATPAGRNPKFVQDLLGHGDVSLTLNVYSHVLPDMGDTAAGAMDDALG